MNAFLHCPNFLAPVGETVAFITMSFCFLRLSLTSFYSLFLCAENKRQRCVLQQVIFRDTDGSAAAAAPWLRMKMSRCSACCSPLLLCWAESPPTPPCPLSYRKEGSGNLVNTNRDTQTATETYTNTCTITLYSHKNKVYIHLFAIFKDTRPEFVIIV